MALLVHLKTKLATFASSFFALLRITNGDRLALARRARANLHNGGRHPQSARNETHAATPTLPKASARRAICQCICCSNTLQALTPPPSFPHLLVHHCNAANFGFTFSNSGSGYCCCCRRRCQRDV